MNQYHANNEYEILNHSKKNRYIPNCSPRYPLANDQNQPLQNTNYKNWMNLCQKNNIGILPLTGSLGTGLRFVSNIIYGLASSTILGNVIGAVSLVATGIRMLWESNNKNEINKIWENMMRYTAELINQRLEENILKQATANLAGLKEALDAYQRALNSWLSLNSFASAETIKSYMRSLHLTFTQDIIGDFTLSGYELTLLPSYAAGASLHLLVLRDIAIYGEKLGFPEEDLNFFYTEQKIFTEKYISHCMHWYNEGLNSIKQVGWTHFNRYRREMTLNVLDVISLFSTYDARIYPVGVKSELTREIYSDVINAHVDLVLKEDQAYFSQTESLYTRQPHLFTWLRGLRLVRNTISSSRYNWYILSGGQNKYSYTNNSSITTGPFMGQDTDYGGTSYNIDIPSGSYIYNLWTRNFEWIYPYTDPVNISDIHFFITDNNSSKEITFGYTGTTILPTIRTDFNFLLNKEGTGPAKYYDYNHILSHILINGSTAGQKRHGYSFAFTHSSVDPYNKIAPDEITQIPAVKAFDISDTGPGQVIAGPGFTGGNLVQLPNNARLKIRLTPAPTNRNYRVRVRYASTGSGTLQAQRWSPSAVFSNNFTYPSTGSSTTFGYLETITTSFNQSGVEIIIQNLSSSQLIVDKIEFIPVDTFANQSLEATQCYNYNQNYNNYNYNQNMDTTYQPNYDNYNQNSDCMCNQGYNGNYNQTSGCTCNPNYNNNYPK